jgi:hypothetical protein
MAYTQKDTDLRISGHEPGYAATAEKHTAEPDVPASGVGELNFDEYTQGGLGRHLGIFSTIFLMSVALHCPDHFCVLTLFSVGRIIGTGIFSTPSSITSSTGSVGAALLLWVLGLLLAGSGLAVWLELGCMIPRSGGEKVYLEAAYRQPRLLITVVFAVQAVALGFTGTFLIRLPINQLWN